MSSKFSFRFRLFFTTTPSTEEEKKNPEIRKIHWYSAHKIRKTNRWEHQTMNIFQQKKKKKMIKMKWWVVKNRQNEIKKKRRWNEVKWKKKGNKEYQKTFVHHTEIQNDILMLTYHKYNIKHVSLEKYLSHHFTLPTQSRKKKKKKFLLNILHFVSTFRKFTYFRLFFFILSVWFVQMIHAISMPIKWWMQFEMIYRKQKKNKWLMCTRFASSFQKQLTWLFAVLLFVCKISNILNSLRFTHFFMPYPTHKHYHFSQ